MFKITLPNNNHSCKNEIFLKRSNRKEVINDLIRFTHKI